MAIPLWQSIHLFALRLIDADCSRWSTSHVADFSNVVVSMHPSHLWLDPWSTIIMLNPLDVCNVAAVKLFRGLSDHVHMTRQLVTKKTCCAQTRNPTGVVHHGAYPKKTVTSSTGTHQHAVPFPERSRNAGD